MLVKQGGSKTKHQLEILPQWVPTSPSTSPTSLESVVRASPLAPLLLAAMAPDLWWGGGGIAPLGGSSPLHSSTALSLSFGSRWCNDQFRREVNVKESEVARRRRLKESSSAVLEPSNGELVVDS